MGGKSGSPPPDYSAMAAANKYAADVSEKLGTRQMDFAERQYAEMKPLAERVAASQIAAQEEQMRQAREYYDYQTGTFRPVEQGLVKQAQEFDTGAYREQLASQAAADTARAFGTAEGITARSLARRGADPGSGNAMALQGQNALTLASARAGAATGARERAEQTGFARKLDVVGLGRNLPGASTAAYQSATGAGSAGVNTAMSAGNQYSNAFGQGVGTQMQGAQLGIQGAGQILNSQTSVYNTAQSQADPLASIAGMALGGWAGGGFKGSDIRLKMNIERVGTDERTQLPVYEFEYKANPGERFRGVMAHEVEVNFPEAVTTRADGYKAVFYERIGMQMVKV
jgi:hypothetical protein